MEYSTKPCRAQIISKNLDGKILVIAGESAKSAKIFPLQNFALYGSIDQVAHALFVQEEQ